MFRHGNPLARWLFTWKPIRLNPYETPQDPAIGADGISGASIQGIGPGSAESRIERHTHEDDVPLANHPIQLSLLAILTVIFSRAWGKVVIRGNHDGPKRDTIQLGWDICFPDADGSPITKIWESDGQAFFKEEPAVAARDARLPGWAWEAGTPC
jgi:hypothetical protein